MSGTGDGAGRDPDQRAPYLRLPQTPPGPTGPPRGRHRPRRRPGPPPPPPPPGADGPAGWTPRSAGSWGPPPPARPAPPVSWPPATCLGSPSYAPTGTG